MGKVVDITSKLELDENPKLKIGEEEITIQADAKNVLKMIGIFGDDDMSDAEKSMKAYELLFSKEDRKKLDEMNISFKDLNTIIESAVDIAIGDDDTGEEESRTTTS